MKERHVNILCIACLSGNGYGFTIAIQCRGERENRQTVKNKELDVTQTPRLNATIDFGYKPSAFTHSLVTPFWNWRNKSVHRTMIGCSLAGLVSGQEAKMGEYAECQNCFPRVYLVESYRLSERPMRARWKFLMAVTKFACRLKWCKLWLGSIPSFYP